MFVLYREKHLWLQIFVRGRVLEAATFFVEGGTREALRVSADADLPSLGKCPIASKLSGAIGRTLDNCCAWRRRHASLHGSISGRCKSTGALGPAL